MSFIRTTVCVWGYSPSSVAYYVVTDYNMSEVSVIVLMICNHYIFLNDFPQNVHIIKPVSIFFFFLKITLMHLEMD